MLAAQSFGYLLRNASPAASKTAVRSVLADVIVQPSIARTHGAGLLFAEAMKGVQHGLHSKGSAFLSMILQQDIIILDDFTNKQLSKHASTRNNHTHDDELDDDDENPTILGGATIPSLSLSDAIVESRVTAVLAECLDALLDYTRRGSVAQLMWDTVLQEVLRRCDAMMDACTREQREEQRADSSEGRSKKALSIKRRGRTSTVEGNHRGDERSEHEGARASSSAAQALALLCRMVEYYRGSRVNDYAPLFELSKKLSLQEYSSRKTTRGDPTLHHHHSNTGDDGDRLLPYKHYVSMTFTSQVLRYYLAIVYAHCKCVGASAGPDALKQLAPLWASAVSKAPPHEALFFIRGLLSPPATDTGVVKYFAPQALASIGRCIVNDTHGLSDMAWPLLMDICGALSCGRASVPVVFMATGGVGPQLAECIANACTSLSFLEKKDHDQHDGEGVVWCALHCMPHAVATPLAALTLFQQITEKLTYIAQKKSGHSSSGNDSSTKLVFLQSVVLELSANLAGQLHVITHMPSSSSSVHKNDKDSNNKESSIPATTTHIVDCMHNSIILLQSHPQNYHAVHAAAEIAIIYKHIRVSNQSQRMLSDSVQFTEFAGLLGDAVSSPSSGMRHAALRFLSTFDQPSLLPPSSSTSNTAEGSNQHSQVQQQQQQNKCDILSLILEIELKPWGVDSGRSAVVSLGRIRNYFEYKRVPAEMVVLVVRALLGVLYIRYSALWPAAAAALAAALNSYPTATWPLLHKALSLSHEEFLAGDFERQTRTTPSKHLHRTAPRQHSQGDDHQDNTAVATLATLDSTVLQHHDVGSRVHAAQQQGSVEQHGGSTDAALRVTYLVRALGECNTSVLESKARDWAPLFMRLSSAKTADGIAISPFDQNDDEDDDEVEEDNSDGDGGHDRISNKDVSQGAASTSTMPALEAKVSARAWRNALKEWLVVLARLKGIRAVAHSNDLCRSIAVHIQDIDPVIQQATLKCLKAYKITWLAPYMDRLLRLADNKTLRAELAAFPLAINATSVRSDDDFGSILPEHREHLVPLLIALLFPKMRKRSGRLGGKGRGIVHTFNIIKIFYIYIIYLYVHYIFFSAVYLSTL